MFDDREKRNVITLMVMLIFMLLLFVPLFTVKSQYENDQEAKKDNVQATFANDACANVKNVNPQVKKVSFTGRKPSHKCSLVSGHVCFSKLFKPTPISKEECNNIKFKFGIKECGYDDDVWAGAVKKCKGVANMATPEDLAYLAEVLYKLPCGGHPKIASDEFYSGEAEYDKKQAESFGLAKSGYLALWSNKEVGNEMVSKPGEYAYGRNYFPTNSSWYPYERYGKKNARMAVCVYRD